MESNDNRVSMPKRLTAENGAKAAFIGEFFQWVQHECPHCHGREGHDVNCDVCFGDGIYNEKVFVSWITIKNIYKQAVELLGQSLFDPITGENK